MGNIKFFIAGTITLIFEVLYWAVIGTFVVCAVLLTLPIWYPLQEVTPVP